jgi:hypothetical protein
VNIPEPQPDAMGGRIELGGTGDGCPVRLAETGRQANPPPIKVKARSEGCIAARKPPTLGAEKSLVWHNPAVTVPQTDTGRRGENPQALVRMLVQELGKLTP